MPASKKNSGTVRSRPDGSFVLVHPDGREERYRVPPVDRRRLAAMTDAEIARQIAEDPGVAPEITEGQWSGAVIGTRLKALRTRLGLSQAVFAARFHIPAASLRDWEQGRRKPDAAMLAYLTVIEQQPEIVLRALDAA